MGMDAVRARTPIEHLRPPSRAAVSAMPRVVLCESAKIASGSPYESLVGLGYELEDCHDGEMLLEAVVARPPDVVVYAMSGESESDLAVLHLLRRILPDAPLILLVDECSLATRREMQILRPMYYAVSPVEAAELREAVRSAILHRRPHH